MINFSMDWFKGKSTGNHRFSHWIWGFPVNFPLIQSIEFPHSSCQFYTVDPMWTDPEQHEHAWTLGYPGPSGCSQSGMHALCSSLRRCPYFHRGRWVKMITRGERAPCGRQVTHSMCLRRVGVFHVEFQCYPQWAMGFFPVLDLSTFLRW